MSQYPEHDKLKACKAASQAQGEFIDWLKGEGIWLCSRGTQDSSHEYFPIFERLESLLARYHGIDFQKLEDEKLAMLDELRASHEKEKLVDQRPPSVDAVEGP